MIRRMKEAGATVDDMIEVYIKEVRCLTETGCAAWNNSLTKADKVQLENIQKTFFKVILGQKYVKYENALKILNLQKLETRRDKICMRFAKKCELSKKISQWFIPSKISTRNGNRYVLPATRTKSYEKSPLFYLAELLNKTKPKGKI